MEPTQTPYPQASGLASAWQRWRARASGEPALADLPCIAVAVEHVRTLSSPERYCETLLALIAQARQRILIATLYLQDDDTGRAVLTALKNLATFRPSSTVISRQFR